MISQTAFIHPLAHVDLDCCIGSGAKIWQFASVTRGADIGVGCVVAPGAMIDGSTIGAGSKVGPGVRMGPGFMIGERCFLGPGVVLCNDLWPRADVTGWEIEPLLDGRIVAVIMDDGASVGANAVVLPGVRLGAACMVAAGAVVDRSVPAGCLFKRDGRLVPINSAWTKRRMKGAR